MAVIKDPENNETSALHAMVDFTNRSVLEIGCGEGRLTWRYADNAAQVTAIDPDGEDIGNARANTPEGLRGKVQFVESTIEDFAGSSSNSKFDIAVFAWSL
jgi:2-polyprenyl-3-methyl-5-hydroxy-6-metoxy-1,4-benzoquinol methylase